MTHIFISHASEQKVDCIRPIVEALVIEGEPVWIDRPGYGECNFGFTQEYIALNDIDHLRSGNSWSDSIQSALRQSGAVLGCLSRALVGQREVILAELTVAATLGKLVTCIVDDLDFGELSLFAQGLLDTNRLQSPRLDPARLREAVDWLRDHGGAPDQLPTTLRGEWEILRGLIADIDRVRLEPRRMRNRDIERLKSRLSAMPIGPVLRVDRLPPPLIYALGDHVNTGERARALIRQTNELVRASTADPELCAQMILREGCLPPPGHTSGDNFWTQAFHVAGLKARRTVAAMLLNPVATWAFQQAQVTRTVTALLDEIELVASAPHFTQGE
jgi:hypothetical protein